VNASISNERTRAQASAGERFKRGIKPSVIPHKYLSYFCCGDYFPPCDDVASCGDAYGYFYYDGQTYQSFYRHLCSCSEKQKHLSRSIRATASPGTRQSFSFAYLQVGERWERCDIVAWVAIARQLELTGTKTRMAFYWLIATDHHRSALCPPPALSRQSLNRSIRADVVIECEPGRTRRKPARAAQIPRFCFTRPLLDQYLYCWML
jgi:hypothetical protein